MRNFEELKREIEKIRASLNAISANIDSQDSDREKILEISEELDKLIVAYMQVLDKHKSRHQ